jgi:hypothetical protein
MGNVEYVMRGADGKAERRKFFFNTAEELADQIVLTDLLTVDEMVTAILNDMPMQDQVQMASLTYKELIELHTNVGRDIRNTFGLWIDGNPNIDTHPDDTSMLVIYGVWKVLTTAPPITSQVMDFN